MKISARNSWEQLLPYGYGFLVATYACITMQMYWAQYHCTRYHVPNLALGTHGGT